MTNTTVNTEEIGRRIRKRRKSMYMTAADIYKKTSIAPTTLSAIEGGSKAPSCRTLLRLSEVLDCTTDWILKGVEEFIEQTQNTNLSTREIQLIDNYRLLTEKDQTEIDEFIQVKLRINSSVPFQREI